MPCVRTSGRKALSKAFEYEAIVSWVLLPLYCLGFCVFISSLIILLSRLLHSYSDIEVALASRACQKMGVIGNLAVLAALGESVLQSQILSFLCPSLFHPFLKPVSRIVLTDFCLARLLHIIQCRHQKAVNAVYNFSQR